MRRSHSHGVASLGAGARRRWYATRAAAAGIVAAGGALWALAPNAGPVSPALQGYQDWPEFWLTDTARAYERELSTMDDAYAQKQLRRDLAPLKIEIMLDGIDGGDVDLDPPTLFEMVFKEVKHASE